MRTRIPALLGCLLVPSLLASSSVASFAGQRPAVVAHYAMRQGTTRQRIAPGVMLTRFTVLGQGGPNKCLLLTVDLGKGVGLDYVAQPHVTGVAPILRTLQASGPDVVAGVNGDFYDIGDTGAPLGIGLDRTDGLLHGPLSGWNSAFYLGPGGQPHIGTLAVHTTIGRHPHLHVTNLNSPDVADDGIGVYTAAWGPAPTNTVTDGSGRGVREVDVQHGRVVSNHGGFSSGGTIVGSLLVGRGAGGRALATLHVGDRAPVSSAVDGNPRMVLTGSNFLVERGVVTVVKDPVTAPRTAVGIEDDTGQVLILEVDGRQKVSHGLTELQLANLMVDLGADDALNLDGGGSSTLVARNAAGALAVMNTPSDGFQRYVADGLAVTYHHR